MHGRGNTEIKISVFLVLLKSKISVSSILTNLRIIELMVVPEIESGTYPCQGYVLPLNYTTFNFFVFPPLICPQLGFKYFTFIWDFGIFDR